MELVVKDQGDNGNAWASFGERAVVPAGALSQASARVVDGKGGHDDDVGVGQATGRQEVAGGFWRAPGALAMRSSAREYTPHPR